MKIGLSIVILDVRPLQSGLEYIHYAIRLKNELHKPLPEWWCGFESTTYRTIDGRRIRYVVTTTAASEGVPADDPAVLESAERPGADSETGGVDRPTVNGDRIR